MSLINLQKWNVESGEEELASKLDHYKAKATWHIFLIRHSQYHVDGSQKDCTLRPLDLLREGAPIESELPVSHWKPEAVYYNNGAQIEAAFWNHIHRADTRQEEDSYEIFICHTNVIHYIVCRALQFPPEGWLRLSLNNGSITHLAIQPSGRVALRTLGDTGFMPPDKITWSCGHPPGPGLSFPLPSPLRLHHGHVLFLRRPAESGNP
ncbi:Serine/threonine-protein phosphatase PGAM5, mitochondrial [Plecturocebus cupreus]